MSICALAPDRFLRAPCFPQIDYNLWELACVDDNVELISSLIYHPSPCPSSALVSLQLNELFRKSDVHKDFMSVRVRNLAPSRSILAFVEAHFKPGEKHSRPQKYNQHSQQQCKNTLQNEI